MRKIDKYRTRGGQNTCGLLKPLNFVIKLDVETWTKIKPIEVTYKDERTYEKLNPPWTDVIATKIFDLHKLPCPFSFKNSQVSKNDQYPYLIFYGSCKECHATVYGECQKEPNPNTGVKISIETYDTKKILHFTKRRLAKEGRVEAKKTLKYIKTTHFKQIRANNLLNDSGTAHPFLHNTGVYRVARHEAQDEDIGLSEFPGDPITSVLSMMDRLPAIREISTIPLVVWYWTENQLELWREAADLNTFISLDASGCFVKAVDIIDGHRSSHIFLYNVVIRLRNKIFTICQMLSESHDTNSIFIWLFAWMESGAPIPKEVVVDCSSALLNAISLAFNGCYYQNYLSKCYKFLMNNNEILPHCLIKRDRAHLIKAVLRWKCFTGANWVQSDFYARCIAYSLEVEDCKLLEEVMTALFIVCQSKTADKDSECSKRKSWLMTKIETFNNDGYSVKYANNAEQNSEDDNDNENIDECNDTNEISQYVQEIHNRSLPLCSNNDDDSSKPNNYYLPKIVRNLIQLYTQFPAWTNVMRSHYSSPNVVSTSTGSECYYRIMRREYSMTAPVSLNRFLLIHLRVINGATKLGRGIITEIKSSLLGNDVHNQNQNQNEILHVSGDRNSEISDSAKMKVFSSTEGESERSIDLPVSTESREKDDVISCNNKQFLKPKEKEKAFFAHNVEQVVTRYMRDYMPGMTVARYVPKKTEFCILKDHVLWSSEFKTLQPKTWIDGSVIDSFMIAHSNKEWKNIYFYPTGQTTYMMGNLAAHEKPTSWPMYNIDFTFQGIVFLPYCYSSHWCLLVLNTEEKTITHFDPRIRRHSGDRAVKFFLRYLAECTSAGKNSLCSIDWTIRTATSSRPMQTDSYNCGVFVMYYMHCLSIGGLTDNADFDPDVYRSDIAHQLIASSESMSNMCIYCLNDKKGVCSTCKSCCRWAHNDCVFRLPDKNNPDTIIVDGICLLCAK